MNKKVLERKKRFLEAREKAGGAAQLQEQEMNKPYKLYFDSAGEIVCFTKEDVEPHEDWLTHDFAQEQLSILLENGTNNYHVVKDPLVDNLYSIELKTYAFTESFVEDYLLEVGDNDVDDSDIFCEVTKDHLKIWFSEKTKKLYEGIDPFSATMKGKRILPFYVTAKNDPYNLFQKHFVSISELIENDVVTLTNNGDFRNFSVYTRRIFVKYTRVYNED